MLQPSSKYDDTYQKIKDAYNQWTKKRDHIFQSIDLRMDELSKGSNPTAQNLMKTIPEDIWEKERKERQFASKLSTEVLEKLLNTAYDEDCKKQKKCKLFGTEFSYESMSDLKIIAEIVAIICGDDKAIIDGGKLEPLKESSLIKDYLAVRIKQFVTCLPYIECNLVLLFKLAIIWLSKVVLNVIMFVKPLPPYQHFDDIQDGPSSLLYITDEFQNWGETVEKQPTYTFFPKTVEGLCKIVEMAKKDGKRIRMSGFRHSWSDLWADNDQIQVAMLPLQVTDKVKYVIDLVETSDPDKPFHVIYNNGEWDDSEFVKIDDPQSGYVGEDGKMYANVRIGSAVCGLQILEWVFDRYAAGKTGYQLPLDVIMSLNSYGGKLSTMSHGAGLKHPTLPDLVVKIEYVDANGKHQAIDDPKLLKAAAGSIGMLGILTHITFRMEATTFASFQPVRVELEKAIPPIGDHSSEYYLQMLRDINSSFYCEWFWFYGCETVYKNAWQDDGDSNEYTGPLISRLDQEYQRSSTYLMGIFQAVILALHDCSFYDTVVNAMQVIIPHLANAVLLAPDDPLTVLAFEAVHFRRGINYLNVRCMEFLIPVPKTAEGEADFSIFQKAWWDIQELIKKYPENGELSPMNLTLETRVLSGSDIYLAPEYGNELGTCSIEVLGTMLVPQESWESFKNEVAEIWASYTDNDGKQLNTRLHWGKELPQKVGGKTGYEFIRDGHRESFKEFKAAIEEIAKMHSFTVAEMRSRFSNEFLETVFGPLWDNA